MRLVLVLVLVVVVVVVKTGAPRAHRYITSRDKENEAGSSEHDPSPCATRSKGPLPVSQRWRGRIAQRFHVGRILKARASGETVISLYHARYHSQFFRLPLSEISDRYVESGDVISQEYSGSGYSCLFADIGMRLTGTSHDLAERLGHRV